MGCATPWTLEEARKNLAIWLEAERAVATGQSYRIGTRSLTRANLSEIRLSCGRKSGVRVMRIVPRDL